MAPQRPDLSRYLDAGTQFVALTRAQASARAAELVGQGQLAQEQVQGFVDELVDESRRRTDEMLDVVRREIQRQMKTLGIATKDDLARLESQISSGSTPRKPAKAQTTATSTAKKAKKAKKPARKPVTEKVAGKKSAKKTTKKSAKKTTKPKQSAAKRAKKSSKSGG